MYLSTLEEFDEQYQTPAKVLFLSLRFNVVLLNHYAFKKTENCIKNVKNR